MLRCDCDRSRFADERAAVLFRRVIRSYPRITLAFANEPEIMRRTTCLRHEGMPVGAMNLLRRTRHEQLPNRSGVHTRLAAAHTRAQRAV